MLYTPSSRVHRPPSEFFVDGTTLPEVDFDLGPSWSGLLPISNAANETRKVNSQAVSVPSIIIPYANCFSSSSGSSPQVRREPPMTSSSGETSISACGIYSFELINEGRTNGGPGCSSLEAALQENGVSVVFEMENLVFLFCSLNLGNSR